ncbi:MAG: L-erythro-3,5-diaminohexanoate dehydrogenase [Caldisericia bacterium]|jgi:L-erythro-3,5-diaminohexanoate dehydrogenase|nr:L-erythro-3,5-diaminohexanoate dehydrogenase [Caldisericia bacterium]
MKGDKFGRHRVLEPVGYLPQPAKKLNNDFSTIYSNEILVNVKFLNIDSSSFTQIKNEAKGDKRKIEEIILKIVEERGKMHNPITGSGGMFVGVIEKIGEDLKDKVQAKEGDLIASLVSLSLTPLKIENIKSIDIEREQVEIEGKAVLFETGVFTKIPSDFSLRTALSLLDVAGAPIQVSRIVKDGDKVLIIGAGGKSGLLCTYVAKKYVKEGVVIALAHSERSKRRLEKLGYYDYLITGNAQDPVEIYEKINEITKGELCDKVINCVNVPDTELSSILSCKERGLVYFFSMATSFTKAALGAEGVGKDIDMLIGNGYAKGHAEFAFNILRECPILREIFEEEFGGK